MLTLVVAALAENAAQVRPWGFLKPSFTVVQDSAALADDADGFRFYGEAGVDGSYEAARVAGRISFALDGTLRLQDAVLLWQPIPYIRLDAGQFRLPIGLGYVASESRRLLPAPALVLAEVGNTDLGAQLTGSLVLQDHSYAQLSTGVFNGEGANTVANPDARFLLAERILITPFGARPRVFEGTDGVTYLGLGGSWLWNREGQGTAAVTQNQLGADLQFAYNVLSLQAEFFTGSYQSAASSDADRSFLGGYAQLASFIPAGWFGSHVELVARGGYHDPDTASQGSADGAAPPARYEGSGGLNIYAFEDAQRFHDLKIQLSYTLHREAEGPEVPDDVFAVAGVARF